MKEQILQHRFEDSLAGVPTIATIHLCLAILLLTPPSAQFFVWDRPQLCVLVSLLFGLLYWRYTWRNVQFNIFIIFAYLGTLALEWQQFGLPEPPVSLSTNGAPKKGFILGLFLYGTPTIYACLRVLLLLPLMLIWRASWRLSSMENLSASSQLPEPSLPQRPE